MIYLTHDGMISSNNLEVGTKILSCADDGTSTWETVTAMISRPSNGSGLELPDLGLTVRTGHSLVSYADGALTPVFVEQLGAGSFPVMTSPLPPVDDREAPTVGDEVLYRTGERIRAALNGDLEVGHGRWMWEQIAPIPVQADLFSLSRRQLFRIISGLMAQDMSTMPSLLMCNQYIEVASLLRHLLTPHGWTVDIRLVPYAGAFYGAAAISAAHTASVGHGAVETRTVDALDSTSYPVTESGRYFAFSPTSSVLYQSVPLT